MRFMLATVLCCAAVVGQISTASAYYYYGSPAGWFCPVCAQPENAPGFGCTDCGQAVGHVKPYPASYVANGQPVCAHRNYRPIKGWCQRVW